VLNDGAISLLRQGLYEHGIVVAKQAIDVAMAGTESVRFCSY
jgi:hypothetical protein